MTKIAELTLPELLERLNTGLIPMSAKVTVTYEDREKPSTAVQDPTLALFAQWERDDARLTLEEQQKNDRIYEEIERNGIPRVRI